MQLKAELSNPKTEKNIDTQKTKHLTSDDRLVPDVKKVIPNKRSGSCVTWADECCDAEESGWAGRRHWVTKTKETLWTEEWLMEGVVDEKTGR